MNDKLCLSRFICSLTLTFACSNNAIGQGDLHPTPASHLSKQAQGLMLKMATMPAPDPVARYLATRGAGKKVPERPNIFKIEGEYDVSRVQTNSTLSYWISSPQQTDPKRGVFLCRAPSM